MSGNTTLPWDSMAQQPAEQRPAIMLTAHLGQQACTWFMTTCAKQPTQPAVSFATAECRPQRSQQAQATSW